MATNKDSMKQEVLTRVEKEGVRFVNLQFTDVVGLTKSVTIPTHQFEDCIDHGKWFDGSSIEGFARIAESDMYLDPDLSTFAVIPWERGPDTTAKVICDVFTPEGEPFPGDPRYVLKRALKEAADLGYSFNTGPELEFFLLRLGPNDEVSLSPHDEGGYFDLSTDLAAQVRKEMVNALEEIGITVETSHHEVATGQHEIDFQYDDALKTADNAVTFRYTLKAVARKFGLHATFMPKPFYGINGSGMHTHMSLFSSHTNVFYDAKAPMQLSRLCLGYIAGILRHAKGFCAITNPLVNSYKRLVPGYEAPTNIAWSEKNRSPLVRVPAARGTATRIELRMPDPSCNPYLALAVMLRAGLDGIERKLDPGPPINKNIFEMSHRERRHLRIDELPGNLSEALDELEKDDLVRETLGDHIFGHFLAAKREEWHDYIRHVSPWEVERYLGGY